MAVRTDLVSLRSRPSWLCGRCLAAAWIALLAYGTLVPFDFDLGGHAGVGSAVITALGSLTWSQPLGGVGGWTVDLVTNLLLYGPLGWFVRLDLQRHSWRKQWWLTALILLSISYGLECTQSLTRSRVGSWIDVVMNTSGGLVFAVATVTVKRWVQQSAFYVYRKGSFVLRRGLAVIGSMRCRRSATVALLTIDAALATAWLVVTMVKQDASSQQTNWMPFAYQFQLSYDMALLVILGRLALYGVLTAVLSAHLLSMPVRHRTRWLVVSVTLIAAWPLLWGGNGSLLAGGDVTEPIIALMAVGLLIVAAHAMAHAVRRCDRRRHDRFNPAPQPG